MLRSLPLQCSNFYIFAPIVLGLIFGGVPALAGCLPAYFDPKAANSIIPNVMVFRHAPPPSDSDTKATYCYGPITDSSAQNVAAQNAAATIGSNQFWSGREWPLVWANRAQGSSAPYLSPNPFYPPISYNGPNGSTEYAIEFSTIAKADAVTHAEILYILGATTSSWQAPLVDAGMQPSDAIAWGDLNASPTAYFTNISQDGSTMVMIDKMIIPSTISTSAYGVILDWEVHDGRTLAQTQHTLNTLAAAIHRHGPKAYLYTNPWDGPNLQSNGFCAPINGGSCYPVSAGSYMSNVSAVKSYFDYISLFPHGIGPTTCESNFLDPNSSYSKQVDFLNGGGLVNFSNVIVTVNLANCSMSDGVNIYNARSRDAVAGYNLFPNGAPEGGSSLTFEPSNAIIEAVLFGD